MSAQTLPVIDLVHPLPGFPDDRRFALVDLDGSGQLCSLTSLDHDDLRFLVAPPNTFFPDYTPEIDDATIADLDISSVEDVMVLVVLNPGETLLTSTANLKAPVVLNTANRRACQVIVDDADLSVSAPLSA
ncbi:flagellar assembly protein FliW [Nocardioides anomalus]|uniref:Flagellar assembly factor FliW n=1 Tax=Nocardioides anomalus TaxID=2712223 RepID=A0A6G6WB91_9ACTN|nr:flagellar assembly protein FliW [Nocardioides anomalus]QIG42479.1 flagellar assembly protein FliW [Nocardioides anomalus]